MRAWVWLLAFLAALPARAAVDAYLLIQDSPLAGFQYHEGKTLWPKMRVGDALTLVREPDNPHDAKAVRVDWNQRKIGYVPRRENTHIAAALDRGQALKARISRLAESRDPWARVRFEIVLEMGTPPTPSKMVLPAP